MAQPLSTFADPCLITCYLPKGKVVDVIEKLHEEKGIEATNFSSGRGRATLQSTSYGAWVEVDVLDVVVATEQAEEVFAFLYEVADIDNPHGGLMVQTRLSLATDYTLPKAPEAD